MFYLKNYRFSFLILSLAASPLFYSCDKVDIEFAATDTASDPNITYYDNFPVDIATYKPDSFITSGHSIITAGFHNDTALGIIKAGSFLQLDLPSTNPVLNVNAVYDSLELLLRPSGQFYGDSTKPITFKVFALAKNISNDAGDTYYNTSSFSYSVTPLAQQTISLNGKTNTVVSIQLSDIAGQDWFDKFKTGNDEISSQEKFINYFKGLYITADSSQTNTIAYFSAVADSPLVRLHYHENGLFAEKKQLDFKYTSAKQFNHINTRFTKTGFTALNTGSSKLLASTESNNQAVLNNAYFGSVKISFSNLLSLKEQHPYVKVVKALLVIRPDIRSYTFPYQLPQALYLHRTDDTNLPGLGIYQTGSDYSSSLQTGSLEIDYVYGENTNYTYDITSFINDKITEGEFSKSALLLRTSLDNADAGMQRLFINNQKNNRPIQLKLYVLGL